MAIWIALLRGINVSGKNMIKMTELKRLMELNGFSRVQTYINSGNVLFESEEGEEALRQRMEQTIQDGFSLSIPVMLRMKQDWERILSECPFTAEVAPDGKNVNVGLLRETPSPEQIAALDPYKGPDEFQIKGREIYLLLQSTADSKLANNLQKLKVPVTIRNWNTMNKLAAIAHAMEA